MRKDGKSQYTIKKEKLLKIKNLINEELQFDTPIDNSIWQLEHLLYQIWELVKDEK